MKKYKIELQPLKIKDYNPNRVIAWIDKKTGEAKTIDSPKWKVTKIKSGKT